MHLSLRRRRYPSLVVTGWHQYVYSTAPVKVATLTSAPTQFREASTGSKPLVKTRMLRLNKHNTQHGVRPDNLYFEIVAFRMMCAGLPSPMRMVRTRVLSPTSIPQHRHGLLTVHTSYS